MATNTYVALDKVTVGTATPSITFTSISGAYTDLILIIKATTLSANYNLRFNGDTGTNYSDTNLWGNGASAVSGRSSNNTVIGLTFTSSGEPMSKIQIQNYASTNIYKGVLIRQDDASNATMATAGLWRNTAAITSISIISPGNIPVGSTFSLYGIAANTNNESSPKATGGYVSSDASYWYHAFPYSGTFIPNQSLTADCLVIAGGGGGGAVVGGGGGAGGLLPFASQSLTATSYAVTIGAGGAGGTGTSDGALGGDSQFAALTLVKGGGGGGGYRTPNGKPGLTGGSGGGAGGTDSGSAGSGGAATSGQGFAGGSGGNVQSSGAFYVAGGGGGAGAVGGNAVNNVSAGIGGAGVNTYSSWATATGTGVNGYYAGGGAGCLAVGAAPVGGLGGGGNGGSNNVAISATNGVSATGSGGGGQRDVNSGTGGSGGSGLIIVRYAK